MTTTTAAAAVVQKPVAYCVCLLPLRLPQTGREERAREKGEGAYLWQFYRRR